MPMKSMMGKIQNKILNLAWQCLDIVEVDGSRLKCVGRLCRGHPMQDPRQMVGGQPLAIENKKRDLLTIAGIVNPPRHVFAASPLLADEQDG